MRDVSYTVLVVADDVDTREMQSSVLKFARYQVLTADDGEAAIALCHTDRPNLVLLDLVMPGLSGMKIKLATN